MERDASHANFPFLDISKSLTILLTDLIRYPKALGGLSAHRSSEL